jgi:diguanylate cyclase (GGDEF)-like protein
MKEPTMSQTPKLIDIATKKVVTINDTQTIKEAITLMYQENHRDVIVLSQTKKSFGILKANDLIRLKADNISFDTPIKNIKYDTVFSINYETSIHEAVQNISSTCTCICLVNENHALCGFVSYHDIISSVDPKLLLEKRTLSDLLISSYLKRANSHTSTKEVIALMDDNIYDCVIIFEGKKAVGIITTKDVVKLFGESQDLELPISTYMTSPLQTVKHTTTIAQSLKFIQEQNFKRLIIEDYDGNIVGQITQEELVGRIYSKWADFMRDETLHLSSANSLLQSKAMQLEQLATVDKLTSLYNRVKFEQKLKEEMSRVQRYKSEPFSIVLFDVDNFKQINDTYGHITGDIVLQRIAGVVKTTIRTTDLACRWGGEEFVIIYPHTNVSQALEASEKIRKLINKLKFDAIKNVSCSFGIAQFEADDTMQSLLARADQAMYQAKKGGKNRVEIAF